VTRDVLSRALWGFGSEVPDNRSNRDRAAGLADVAAT
jgi:hypothetical protein